VKKDINGNIIEILDSSVIGPIKVKPNESKAYYRQAKISTDPFEQFRNYYLVCENIADKIRIKDGQGSLKEQPLLEYAIRKCFVSNLGQLEKIYTSVYGSLLGGDIVSTVSELLYKANRCQLNHAKSTADKKVPFNVYDEESVKKAIPIVESLALALLKYEDDSL
jgi:hypothetical protein